MLIQNQQYEEFVKDMCTVLNFSDRTLPGIARHVRELRKTFLEKAKQVEEQHQMINELRMAVVNACPQQAQDTSNYSKSPPRNYLTNETSPKIVKNLVVQTKHLKKLLDQKEIENQRLWEYVDVVSPSRIAKENKVLLN